MATTIEDLVLHNRRRLDELERRIGYRFRDRGLLQLALVHSSFGFERLRTGRNNELLEFLGDAVLDLAVGLLLYQRFPDQREGVLTRLRAGLVNESGLAAMARRIGLGEFLCLGRGEESTGGRDKASILACAYEALVGALFLDGGYEAAQAFVLRFFPDRLEAERERLLLADAKSRLQEWLQERYNEGPTYVLESESGPAHAKVFGVSVRFQDRVLGRGEARNKKEAEQQAAAGALRVLMAEEQDRRDDGG